MITISDAHHIKIDGKDAGHVIDAVRNAPECAAEIKAAFDVWFLKHAREHRESIASIKDAADKSIATMRSELEQVKAERDILGTKEEAQDIHRRQEVDRLQAEIKERADRLSALRGKVK